MSQVFIEIPPENPEDESEFLQLSVSTSLTIGMENEVTANPIADRRTIADHSVSRNKTFTISGILTDIVNLGISNGLPQLSVSENLRKFEDLRDSRKPFTLHYDEDQKPSEDCVFRQVNFNKASNQGSSYSVVLMIEQVNVSKQVLASNERFVRDPLVQNSAGSRDLSGNGNTEEEDLTSNSLFQSAGGAFVALTNALGPTESAPDDIGDL